MSRIIHLVLSDETFGGFEHYVQLTPAIETLDQLINTIVGKLRETLIFHNMENARIILQRKHFHIHSLTLNAIRNRPVNDTVYVCNH